jgi:hypothetical protein
MAKTSKVTALLVTLLGVTVAVHLFNVCLQYPLFPFSPEDIDWSNAWLYMTVLDFYGSTLCMCAIACYTEPNLLHGIIWSALFCLLGSPFVCAYTVYRLLFHHTLKLGSSDIRFQGGLGRDQLNHLVSDYDGIPVSA